MDNVLGYNIVIGEFELQSNNYVHVQKSMNSLIPPAMS